MMIKEMLGAKEVGYYAAAVKLSETWYFIPMVITSSLFPAIINAKKVSEEFYYARLQKLYDLMVWMAIVVALPTTFFAPWIIEILFGSAYLPTASVLSIYIWASVFVFLSVVNGFYLINENYTMIAFYRTLVCAIVNIFLNVLMIPEYGIKGAAVATLISYSFLNIIVMLFPKTYKNSILMLKSLLLVDGIRMLFRWR